MNRGKILKIRMGHEANCSSGMVSGAITVYACIGQVPLALITAFLLAIVSRWQWFSKWRWLSWIIPQVLGAVFIAFYIGSSGYGNTEYGYEAISWSAIIGASFALAISLGYYAAPRLSSPFWLVPLLPAAFIVGVIPVIFLVSLVLDFLSYYLGSVPGAVMLIHTVPWTPG